MPFIRKSFYMFMGLTFPFFWAFHYDGFLAYLYQPIQQVTGVTGAGWPSFITASIIYIAVTLLFENLYGRLYKTKDSAEFSAHLDDDFTSYFDNK